MKVFKGTIITCDAEDTVCNYLVEKNGKIQYVGDRLSECYQSADIIDLGERALMPSFSDSHLHFSSYSLFSSTLDVRDVQNFDQLSDIIKKYIHTTGSKLILGFGISAHSVEEQRMITRTELDAIEPDIPMMLVKYDGHASVVNTSMLKMLPKKLYQLHGFDAQTGQLLHESFYATTDYISSKVSVFSLLKYMLASVDRMADNGIGLVHPAEGVGFPLDLDVDLVRFISGGFANPLLFRVFFQTMDIQKVIKRKLPRIGGCFATALDGCFGSMDAALIETYENDSNNKGILVYPDKDLFQFVQKAHDTGLQVQLHAIGDAAFDQATRAFESALKNNYRNDHRHSIIHGCMTTPKGLERCARYQINIASQPAMLHLNLEPLSYLEKILGNRVHNLFPHQTMLDMGIPVTGGSDAPVTLPDPVSGIYSACNHFNPAQSVSVRQALKMFTIETARAGFDDEETGSLESGKQADMVILNKNPLAMDPQDLLDLKIQTLFLGGKKYKKDQTLFNLIWRSIFNRRK